MSTILTVFAGALAAVLLIVVVSCHRRQAAVSPVDQLVEVRGSDASRREIATAIGRLRVGMSASDMLGIISPICRHGPYFRVTGSGSVEYLFALGESSQVRIAIENPEGLLPIGPSTPNGQVVGVGPIEPKEEWRLKWEDSNELE